jgi:NAD(P)-dependent dehydrogenase (short-subunit alcohol dehydrogenase family)
MDAMQELCALAAQEKLDLLATRCDLCDEDSIVQAVELACNKFGTIDILVNNAGFGLMGALETVPVEEARRQLEVNTVGPIRLIQLVVPEMRAQRWGRIINISSIAGRVLIPIGGWYSASKFALEALSDALRLELEPFGIYTVSLLPGTVKSEFRQNLVIADAPPPFPSLYRSLIELLRVKRLALGKHGITSEQAAEVIVRAAEVRKPKARYVLTRQAKLFAFVRRFVTDRGWDWLTRRAYGIDRIERDYLKQEPE